MGNSNKPPKKNINPLPKQTRNSNPIPSQSTLKQISNRQINLQPKKQKKVRFLQNTLSPPHQTPTKQQSTNQNNHPSNITKYPKYKYTESLQGRDSGINNNIQSSNFSNTQLDSLRQTHINIETKKSQVRSNNEQNSAKFKSVLYKNPKSLINVNHLQTLKSKSDAVHSRNAQFNSPSKSNGSRIQQSQVPSIQENKNRPRLLGIPSRIDDIESVRLTQTNKSGQGLRNTIKMSQITINQICQQPYDARGYFIPTDTQQGQKPIQKQQSENPQSLLSNKNFSEWIASKLCGANEQNLSGSEVGCKCSLFQRVRKTNMTQRTVENSFEKFELGNSNKSGDVKMLDMSGNDVISSISKSNI